jgi:hypothetical protein
MKQPSIQMTAPLLSEDATVWFSVYGFGWGYRAFALPYETVCSRLGAGDTSDQQIRLAFELSKRLILDAVQRNSGQPYEGEGVSLPAEAL